MAIETTLAGKIRAAHERVLTSGNEAVAAALEVGRLLTLAKKDVPHGEWGRWVKANCQFGERQVQRYLKLYENRAKLPNTTSEVAFGSVEAALKSLPKPKTAPKPDDTSFDVDNLEPAPKAKPGRGQEVATPNEIKAATTKLGELIRLLDKIGILDEFGIPIDNILRRLRSL